MSNSMSDDSVMQPSKRGLKELYEKSFLRWFSQVLFDWLIIISVFVIIYHIQNLPLKIAACIGGWLIIGARQHALAILGHEGAHGLVSENKLLNDWAVRIFCSCPLGTDFDQYREFHLKHHAYTSTDQDPEIILKKIDNRWYLPLTWGRLIRRIFLDAVGLGIPDLFRFSKSNKPKNMRGKLSLLLWWIAALGITIWGKYWLAFGLLVVSLHTSFWAIFALRIWTEHVGTGATHQIRASWWQKALFLPHNTWVHDVHHANVNIPFYNLERGRAFYPADKLLSVGELIRDLCNSSPMASGEHIAKAN